MNGAVGAFHCIDLEEDLTLVLKSYGVAGSLMGTLRLDTLNYAEHQERTPLPFFARGSDCFFAVGHRTSAVSNGKVEPIFGTPTGMIHHLTGSPMHTRSRIVAGCERGGVVLWGDRAGDPSQSFAMEMPSPVVGLTRGGWAVATTRTETQLYDTHDRRLTLGATFPTGGDGNTSEPIAVLPQRSADRLAIVLADGRVLIYETPRRN